MYTFPWAATAARACARQLVNIAIVWFFDGFLARRKLELHILWGLYYCVLPILEKTFFCPI